METKRVTENFEERGNTECEPEDIQDLMDHIEEAFRESDAILTGAGMSTSNYESQSMQIDIMTKNMGRLKKYVSSAHEQAYRELDLPLSIAFANGATEALSAIILGEITTENTFRMEEHCTLYTECGPYISKQVKPELTMRDFIGVEEIDPGTGDLTLENIETVGEFASLFRTDYEQQAGAKSMNEILQEPLPLGTIMTYGEYEHEGYHPESSIASDFFDFTTTTSLIEALTGKDPITGERISSEERASETIEASIGVGTLFGGIVIEAAGVGGKAAVSAVGKSAVVDWISDTVADKAGSYCMSKGMSPGTALLVEFLVGGSVSGATGRKIFKDTAEDEVKRVAKSTGKTVEEMTEEAVDGAKKAVKSDIETGLPKIEPKENTVGIDDLLTIESGKKTSSEIARSWQGTGKYPGIDDYVDINVKKSTVLYRGEPNGTEYFTTLDAIEQSGRDATKLFEGLQVEKNPIHGYRGEMQGYIFNEDVASAYGITNANPQFGKGGLPQYYVPDVQDLIDKGILAPVDNIKLNK